MASYTPPVYFVHQFQRQPLQQQQIHERKNNFSRVASREILVDEEALSPLDDDSSHHEYYYYRQNQYQIQHHHQPQRTPLHQRQHQYQHQYQYQEQDQHLQYDHQRQRHLSSIAGLSMTTLKGPSFLDIYKLESSITRVLKMFPGLIFEYRPLGQYTTKHIFLAIQRSYPHRLPEARNWDVRYGILDLFTYLWRHRNMLIHGRSIGQGCQQLVLGVGSTVRWMRDLDAYLVLEVIILILRGRRDWLCNTGDVRRTVDFHDMGIRAGQLVGWFYDFLDEHSLWGSLERTGLYL